MLVINFFGGPCAGKSAIAAGVFSQLKLLGLNCELVTEYVKEAVYQGMDRDSLDQQYLFAHQHRRQEILKGKVDYAVTDSPLLLNCVYGKLPKSLHFQQYVVEVFQQYNNLNFFIQRVHEYQQQGRWETEAQADQKAAEIFQLLQRLGEKVYTVRSGAGALSEVMAILNPVRLGLV